MKKFLICLSACLLLCSAALAGGALEAPYAPDSPGAAVAASVAAALGRELRLTEDASLPQAAEALFRDPEILLCADQSLLISGLQGYTSQDVRTALRPVCRIGEIPLYLVVNRGQAAAMGITDAASLLAWIGEHEYEANFARHIDADPVDRAVTRLAETIPVLTEYYAEEEIPDILASGAALAAVVRGDRLNEADKDMFPLCCLGAERSDVCQVLPSADELGIPVCEGVRMYLFASADADPETVSAAADACLKMSPASVRGATGFLFAPLSGETLDEEIRDLIADYIGYMTSEGLFFYEE